MRSTQFSAPDAPLAPDAKIPVPPAGSIKSSGALVIGGVGRTAGLRLRTGRRPPRLLRSRARRRRIDALRRWRRRQPLRIWKLGRHGRDPRRHPRRVERRRPAVVGRRRSVRRLVVRQRARPGDHTGWGRPDDRSARIGFRARWDIRELVGRQHVQPVCHGRVVRAPVDRATGCGQPARSPSGRDTTGSSAPVCRGIPGRDSYGRRARCWGRSGRSCSTCLSGARAASRRPACASTAGAGSRRRTAAGRSGRA